MHSRGSIPTRYTVVEASRQDTQLWQCPNTTWLYELKPKLCLSCHQSRIVVILWTVYISDVSSDQLSDWLFSRDIWGCLGNWLFSEVYYLYDIASWRKGILWSSMLFINDKIVSCTLSMSCLFDSPNPIRLQGIVVVIILSFCLLYINKCRPIM